MNSTALIPTYIADEIAFLEDCLEECFDQETIEGLQQQIYTLIKQSVCPTLMV
jgi:hypothetical protein